MGINPIRFGTYGPFTLERQDGVITRETLSSFWHKAPEVALGIGVYIIGSKNENGLTPWYVGKTDKGFRKRFEQHLGKLLFNQLATKIPDENLFVMFLARHTDGGKLKKARQAGSATKTKAVASILRLEYDVLKVAHSKNHGLMNKSNRVYLKKLSVPGFSGSTLDDSSPSAKTLRKLFKT